MKREYSFTERHGFTGRDKVFTGRNNSFTRETGVSREETLVSREEPEGTMFIREETTVS